MNNITFWHRVQLPDGSYTPGAVHHGPDGGDWPTTRFGMPEDLTGKRVLDIGAWDGFFSFEAEKRGANIIVATNPEPPKGPSLDGLRYLQNELLSKVAIEMLDIETERHLGQFDLVLFYGVLYHLRNPLEAMKNVAEHVAAGGVCLLETAMAMEPALISSKIPLLEYHPNFNGDSTNFFYPNAAWIKAAAQEYGFTDVELVCKADSRSTYRLTKPANPKKTYTHDPKVTKNTLVDKPRLNNLAEYVEQCSKLDGDMAEVGVYKGGTAHLIASRTTAMVHLFDTFEGMPETSDKDLHKKGDFADTSLQSVSALLGEFGNVTFYPGFFPVSVTPDVKHASYSFVHIDVDIYQSVKDCLEFFSYRMIPGGIIALDDYNAPSCPGAKLATDEFCAKMGYKLEPTVQSQAIIRF